MDTTTLIAVASIVISVASAVFTWQTAKAAKDTIKQTVLMKLFSTFDLASQVSIAQPDLLYVVHGLDKSIPPEEAKCIAYMSLLMDGFQHFNEFAFNGDFDKMERIHKNKSTFLNRLLAVKANQGRWQILKKLYYGDFAVNFTKAIDSIIEYENNRRSPNI